MTTVEQVTLWTHILAGFVALFAGVGAMGTLKGGRRHRWFGRTFVRAMAVVSASALLLFALEPEFLRLFLGLVAVFSFYFAFSGYRVLSRKRPDDEPTRLDWTAVGLLGVASAGLVAVGVQQYLDGGGFAVVMLAFGAIGTALAVADARTFRRPVEPGTWVAEHLTRMGAGYIAAVSAFSAVNFHFLPVAVRWLWPTLVGTPVLAYLARKYEPGPPDGYP